MTSMKRVYELQERDAAISVRRSSLAKVRASLEDESSLINARASLKELEERLDDQSTRRRRLDTELRAIGEKLSAVEQRLYSGSVKSAKELTASEGERAYIQEQNRESEDEMLELMVLIEDGEAARATKKELLERLESDRAEEEVRLQKDEQELTAQLAELTEGRVSMAAQVPAGVLSLYESLRTSRDGVAVVRVERGMCRGCRVALTTSELQRVRTSQTVVQCDSCGRMLYAV